MVYDNKSSSFILPYVAGKAMVSQPHSPRARADVGDSYSDGGIEGTLYVCQFNEQSSKWECATAGDYKSTILQQVIEEHKHVDGSQATIDQLKEFGITVYLVDSDNVDVALLRQVVEHVSASRSDRSKSTYANQRCLLYRDKSGRLYNLTLNNGCDGLASTWRSLHVMYSGLQAMIAFTVLSRAYGCADVANSLLKSTYILFILGFLLYQEMGHVWLNVAMFIQGMPSVAAYTIITSFDSDWPRKVVILLLTITTAMDVGSVYQRYCILASIGFAMILLVANLGSRAWYFMKWKPLRGCGGCDMVLAPYLSLFAAVITGLLFPYIGFTRIQVGGKSAIQLIIWNCILVSLFFVASGFDIIQQVFIDPIAAACNQQGVTISVGVWIALSVSTSIFASQKIIPPEPHPEDANPLLVEEHTSPVGYCVPNFPNFPIDPIHFGKQGLECCSVQIEMLVGLLVGVGFGAFVVSTALYSYMDGLNGWINSA